MWIEGNGSASLNRVHVFIQSAYSNPYGCGDAFTLKATASLTDCIGHFANPTTSTGSGIRITTADGTLIAGGGYNGRYGILLENDPSLPFNFIYITDVIFDTTYSHGVYLAPGTHHSTYSQVRIQDCHFATQSGDTAGCGIYIANDIASLIVSGCNISGYYGVGIVLGATDKVPRGASITGNSIQNNGRSAGYGIVIPPTGSSGSGGYAAETVISGNAIGNAIPIYGAATQVAGVYFVGSTGQWRGYTVSANQLAGNTVAAIAFDPGPTRLNLVVGQNGGADDITPTVATAATLALPVNSTVVLTGATGVTAITGLWEGRTLTLVPSSNPTFTAGATIGNTITATAGKPLLGVVAGGKLYLS